MSIPEGVGVIDLMMGIPLDAVPSGSELTRLSSKMRRAGSFRHGAVTCTRTRPRIATAGFDAVAIKEMDRWVPNVGMVPVTFDEPVGRGRRGAPRSLLRELACRPQPGCTGRSASGEGGKELGVVAATVFPAGCPRRLPSTTRRCTHSMPSASNWISRSVSTPAYLAPASLWIAERVELMDTVCYDFPELRLVTRHGCEPWVDLAVKLILKWPNLYYSTSAFAPRYYPTAVVDYANTRGADKVMYAGYFPSGLSLERIFTEMPQVPFRVKCGQSSSVRTP